MTSPEDHDPLDGGDKAPAMSFDNEPDGTVKYVDVSEPGKQVQQTVFGTKDKAFWPPNADGSPGKPKMAAVYNGVGADGEPLSLWAPIPSDLLAKLKEAQTKLGHRIGATGQVDRIYVKLVNRIPASNPAYKKNVHAVKIESIGPKAPAASPDPIGDDPWGSSAPANPPAGGFDDTPPF